MKTLSFSASAYIRKTAFQAIEQYLAYYYPEVIVTKEETTFQDDYIVTLSVVTIEIMQKVEERYRACLDGCLISLN